MRASLAFVIVAASLVLAAPITASAGPVKIYLDTGTCGPLEVICQIFCDIAKLYALDIPGFVLSCGPGGGNEVPTSLP